MNVESFVFLCFFYLAFLVFLVHKFNIIKERCLKPIQRSYDPQSVSQEQLQTYLKKKMGVGVLRPTVSLPRKVADPFKEKKLGFGV